MTLSASISRLKRKAKLLSREAQLPLNQALNLVAQKEGYKSWGLLINKNPAKKEYSRQMTTAVKAAQITSLPLSGTDRSEFIETANIVFEKIVQRIEPDNPEIVRQLWNPEDFVDALLTKDMLPISRDYALSLIDAFLVHDVIGLAVRADDMAQKGK